MIADLLVRLTYRVVAKALFRVRVRVLGAGRLPRTGPALLVANHLTHLDAFAIGACIQPVVRFLVWKPYYDSRLFRWGLRLARAVPIGGDRASIVAAIAQARSELLAGEVVCIFAEGSISRSGDLQPFGRGLEAIVRGIDAPVIPVRLDGLWESVFSYRGGRFFWKRPRHLRHPVVISFGAAVEPSATEVRQAVMRLGK